MKQMESIPVCQKLNLTIQEAAEYSNIGMNKLRKMAKEPDCPFVLNSYGKCLIKRKAFEAFLEKTDVI